MKKILFLGFLFVAIIGCEKGMDDKTDLYVAKIVGYDLNCSTCILAFPYDSVKLKSTLGESPKNYYQTVNLNKTDFQIGQMIKVKVRKALETELRACIAMYPTFNYENIYVSEYQYYKAFSLNNTIELGYKDCLNDSIKQTTICFESVLTDSRCPEDVVCVWAGEAIARFQFKIYGHDPVFVDLHTGTVDTVINDYKFSFIDLLPHPNTKVKTYPEDYKARIVIKQK